MGSGKPEEFQNESLQDSQSIVSYLEELIAGLRSGRLLFRWGDREMVLEPGGLLHFKVKAKRKEGRVKIQISISWRDGEDIALKQEPLVIRGGEP